MPILVVIAGANGSGKTTLTKRIRETHKRFENFPIVNPDEIMHEECPDNPSKFATGNP